MKTIGLIGGMSWESTLVYYRMLNEGVRARRGALHSAAVLLHSLDFESVVRLQRAGQWDAAGALLGAAGAGLAGAGADCVLICTNTMHLVSEAVGRAAGVPLIDIIAETGREVAAAGRRRPLLLATRYTMEHGFYADRMRAGAGVDVLVPGPEDRGLVHGIIFDELCQGLVRETSRTPPDGGDRPRHGRRGRQRDPRLHRDLPAARSRSPAGDGLRLDHDPRPRGPRLRAGRGGSRAARRRLSHVPVPRLPR